MSEHLVETMNDRGVNDARLVDMFALPEAFDRDRFRSAHVIGTQIGLAESMSGVREFLVELGYVTTPDATVVLDNYDPAKAITEDVFAYRNDAAPGLGYRVYHEEYEDEIGKTLLFRVFSVDRLQEATVGTPWTVIEVSRSDLQWRAVLEKEDAAPTENSKR